MSSPGESPAGSSSNMPTGALQSGPPYLPPGAPVGGRPDSQTDIPVSAVLLVLFIISAATHMFFFQRNRIVRKRIVVPSLLLFIYSMTRIVTLSLRIALAKQTTSIDLAIAATVFIAAGVVILFLVNLVFAFRIFRALQATTRPKLVRASWFAQRFFLFSVVAMLIAVVVSTVRSFFTLDSGIRQASRDTQLVGVTYLAVLAFLPIIVVAVGYILPQSGGVIDFGVGNMAIKACLVIFTSAILTLGAGYRAIPLYEPRTEPEWWHSRAAFYSFNFGIELLVVGAYAVARVDKRFWLEKEGDASKTEKTLARNESV